MGPRTLAITPRWRGDLCVVAATGPSLTSEVADACRGHRCIAVSDAYRLFDFAEIMYSNDAAWWDVHRGCPEFRGEKWSSHQPRVNDKLAVAEKHGLSLVAGRFADGFSLDPAAIHYGSNSGFQALNIALLTDANPIVLVGFNMSKAADGRRHFFGDHQRPLNNRTEYERFIPAFQRAAKMLPQGRRIINATPDSKLGCFPRMTLSDALR